MNTAMEVSFLGLAACRVAAATLARKAVRLAGTRHGHRDPR
jgi:hypothetical protein